MRDILTGDAAPNTFVGSGGDDRFYVDGGGSDVVTCGDGTDEVFLDRLDIVRFRFDAALGTTCETVDDGQPPTTRRSRPAPSGLTNDPTWQFTSDEPWAEFECAVVDSAGDLGAGTTTWSPCRPGERASPPDGRCLGLRSARCRRPGQRGPRGTRAPSRSTRPHRTQTVQGPSGTTSDPTPEFFFSSPDDPNATFVCGFDREAFFECSSPVSPDPPLSDGDHILEVAAIDAAGNRDATPARISFRVDTGRPGPGPGDGPAPNPQKSPVQQAKIIIGSLVLISGNAVKMSRKGRVSISLTCAGAAKCNGRLSITTAEPVSKRDRKLVTLGAKKFTIAANKKRRINVRFSKSKMRLAKRLKRFKAKAVIREIDSTRQPAHLDPRLRPPGSLSPPCRAARRRVESPARSPSREESSMAVTTHGESKRASSNGARAAGAPVTQPRDRRAGRGSADDHARPGAGGRGRRRRVSSPSGRSSRLRTGRAICAARRRCSSTSPTRSPSCSRASRESRGSSPTRWSSCRPSTRSTGSPTTARGSSPTSASPIRS